MRILEANDFMVLHQVDAVRLKSSETLVELPRRFLLRSAVDLGHQERARAIAIAERPAHAPLALAVVVVPAVVQKGDPAIDRLADETDRHRVRHRRQREMPAAQTDGRHPFARLPQHAIGHLVARRLRHGSTSASSIRLPNGSQKNTSLRLIAGSTNGSVTIVTPRPRSVAIGLGVRIATCAPRMSAKGEPLFFEARTKSAMRQDTLL